MTLLSIALGVGDGLPRNGAKTTSPRWSHHLAPLAHAPLPRGRKVLLILPEDLSRLDAKRLFFETVWWRPWIRWRPVRSLDAGSGPALAVLIHPSGDAPIPPEPWHEVWNSGWIHVLARTGSLPRSLPRYSRSPPDGVWTV